jgi:hypothetical protein
VFERVCVRRGAEVVPLTPQIQAPPPQVPRTGSAGSSFHAGIARNVALATIPAPRLAYPPMVYDRSQTHVVVHVCVRAHATVHASLAASLWYIHAF